VEAKVEAKVDAKVEEGDTLGLHARPNDERRLWPSVEVRAHWLHYVATCATYGQLSLAGSSLRDHMASFGVLGKRFDAASCAAARRRCEHVWGSPPDGVA